MKAYVTVRIDTQDVFDELFSDKKVFLFNNFFQFLSYDDTVKELEYRCYNINLKKTMKHYNYKLTDETITLADGTILHRKHIEKEEK